MFTEGTRRNIVRAIRSSLLSTPHVPFEENLTSYTKKTSISWSAVENFIMSNNQNSASFQEQSFVVVNDMQSVSIYAHQFGSGTEVHTKNTIVHNYSGRGKSYVGGYMYLGILALILQLVMTALIGTSANMCFGAFTFIVYYLSLLETYQTHTTWQSLQFKS